MANEKFKVKFGLAVGDTAATVDGTSGDIVTVGDLAVNGGDITTTSTTANIVNATATTVNIGGAGTTVSIGANTGTTTVNNSLVADDISVATVDTTNLEVTNIKAKDGTAAIVVADSTGAVTVSAQFTGDSANLNRFQRTVTGTASNVVLAVNRNRTDAPRAVDGGPWLGFEYTGTDNTQATSFQNVIQSRYQTSGNHQMRFMQGAGDYATPTLIAQLQRGNYLFNNTSGGQHLSLTDTTAILRGTTTTITNNANTTTYATFASSGTTITGAGLHQITRTTVGTPGSSENRPSMNIQLSRSDQVAPNDLDGTGFRYRVNGSNATNYTIADMSANYRTGGDNVWSLNLANGDQTGATFSGLTTLQSKISQTTISAGTASGTPGASTVSTVATFNPSSVNFASGGVNYAAINTGSATFTNTGINQMIRQGSTGAQVPALLMRYERTDQTGSQNNDGVDFRLGTGGTSTSDDIARFDAQYKSTGDNEIGMSVSTDSFVTDTDRIYVGSRASTKIRTTPSGGGTADDTATFTQLATTIKSDTITLEAAGGTDYVVIDTNKALFSKAVRTTITSATVAKGGTFTPAATALNSIILEITAGSGTTTIDVSNLTVTGENGVFDIMVYNNSGGSINSNALLIVNSGNTALDHGSSIANGARAMFEINCVDIYANAKYAGDAV